MVAVSPRQWKNRDGTTSLSYQVSWYDGHKRKRRQFTGKGARAKAALFAAKIKLTLEAGAAPASNITVLEAGRRWVEGVKRSGRERSTVDGYSQHVEIHFANLTFRRGDTEIALSSLAVANLTSPDCEAIKHALLGRLSTSMARKVLGSLRMMLADCVRRGTVQANAAAATRIVDSGRGEGDLVIPTKAELQRILGIVRTAPPSPPHFLEAWIMTGIFTGIRPSEARDSRSRILSSTD